MRNKSVLLIDDEQPVLFSMGNYLERNEFTVKSAISGQAAITELGATSFDLVITDVVMDGMSGLEVLQEVKNHNGEVGVFILTGNSDIAIVIEAFRLGADDVFFKPCDMDELIFKMNTFLEKHTVQKNIQPLGKYLPLCMYCKKIRVDGNDNSGQWLEMEKYLGNNNDIIISHGCCPECFERRKKYW